MMAREEAVVGIWWISPPQSYASLVNGSHRVLRDITYRRFGPLSKQQRFAQWGQIYSSESPPSNSLIHHPADKLFTILTE
jgi:hypothetical protein